MLALRAAPLLSLLLLAGCVTGPNYQAPQIALSSRFSEGDSKQAGDISQARWWLAFRDQKLNGLVDRGLAENLSIQQALERIAEAQSNITVSEGGALPALTADASDTGSGTDGSFSSQPSRNTVSGGLTLSWLLDFWGQYKRAKEGAIASLDAAYASADSAKLTYLSDLTKSYVSARYYQARISIAQENLGSRRETLNLTKLQLEAGAASRLDVVQAEGLVNSTLAEIPGYETNFRVAAHHIATLLAVSPASIVAELQKSARQPVAAAIPRAGIPADLIRNRPDIRIAERNLAAAVARIGVAEAQLYPTIRLSGSISPSYISTNAASGSATSWSFGPSLSLPILDGGVLRANVDIANSTARQQYLTWKSTVLTAVEEVENALSAVNRDRQTVDALNATVKSYQEALELSTSSYRDGASSLLDVLDAQRSVSTAQASLAQAVQQMATDFISLNIAIGGGYAIPVTQKPIAISAR